MWAGRDGVTPRSRRNRPLPGNVDVRLVASSPEAARQVAEVLRRCFASSERRSCPVGTVAGGTRLHLTVDTARSRVRALLADHQWVLEERGCRWANALPGPRGTEWTREPRNI